jgi:hypothetical protein
VSAAWLAEAVARGLFPRQLIMQLGLIPIEDCNSRRSSATKIPEGRQLAGWILPNQLLQPVVLACVHQDMGHRAHEECERPRERSRCR